MDELGSPGRETVAVFERVWALTGAVAVMVIVAVLCAAIAAVLEQVTVAVPEHDQPADAATDTLLRPAGRVSVRMLELAGALAWPKF